MCVWYGVMVCASSCVYMCVRYGVCMASYIHLCMVMNVCVVLECVCYVHAHMHVLRYVCECTCDVVCMAWYMHTCVWL